MNDKNVPTLFHADEIDPIKDAYYPRINENIAKCNEKMTNLGFPTIDENVHYFYKEVFPKFFEMEYNDYNTRVQIFINRELSEEDPEILPELLTSVLTEEEFSQFHKNNPRFLENHEIYLERRKNPNRKFSSTDIFGLSSKEIYDDLKRVYVPTLGEKINDFLHFYNQSGFSGKQRDDEKQMKEYFTDVVELYPLFCESYEMYLNRTAKSKFSHLRMTEVDYARFLIIFPRPFELYHNYVKRIKNGGYFLTQEEFEKYQLVFPLVCETYENYELRMQDIRRKPMNIYLYTYLKNLCPQENEDYDKYTLRQSKVIKKFLINETEKEIDFLVKKMDITHMAPEAFKSFKKSFPSSLETYKSYKTRIQPLCDPNKDDSPGILPEEMFNDIKNLLSEEFENSNDYRNKMANDYRFFTEA